MPTTDKTDLLNAENSEYRDLFLHLFSFRDYFDEPEAHWQNKLSKIKNALGEALINNLLSELAAYFMSEKSWFSGKKGNFVKGLCWLSALHPSAEGYAFLAQIIERCFQKNGKRRLAPSIGQVATNALIYTESPEAVKHLLQIQTRQKDPKLLALIERGLKALEVKQNVDIEAIQDQILPEFGLQEGSLNLDIGEYQAQIYVESYGKIHLEWLRPDGKNQKSIPAQVKREYAPALAQVKHQKEQIKRTLQIQKQRLENAWRNNREWAFADWEKYLLNHEIMRLLSRSLIWQVQLPSGDTVSLIWRNGQLEDWQGKAFSPPKESLVKLWHPVEAGVEEVLAWRNYLFQQELSQAFKQAFREVYLLTEAEENTETYSNRFSAHILQQNKLWALANQRNWEFKSHYFEASPELALPAYGLSVSLDISYPSWGYVGTERVVFYGHQQGTQALALKTIPKVAFSEAMRDIDLFIAISSIGSNPEWDGSEEYKNYWQDFAFGEKSETVSAKNRREILERIVPKLKIANLCSFEGNFLQVKGKIRSYKINLGSGNILMLPHDEYLCIVPDRRSKNASKGVFLPFEGDTILSLILSKAFLLAEDDNIEDPTILSQIH